MYVLRNHLTMPKWIVHMQFCFAIHGNIRGMPDAITVPFRANKIFPVFLFPSLFSELRIVSLRNVPRQNEIITLILIQQNLDSLLLTIQNRANLISRIEPTRRILKNYLIYLRAKSIRTAREIFATEHYHPKCRILIYNLTLPNSKNSVRQFPYS